MLVSKTYEIDSCDDVELGIKRESKLEFKLCFDDEKEVKALVFIIPGLGGDADENYREHLAEFVASEYNAAVASVNYHCIGNRPQTGSTFFMDDIDKLILKTSCEALGIDIEDKISEQINGDGLFRLLEFVDLQITNLKKKEEIKLGYIMKLHATLQPTKNEYQNFGIMQAQDLLNVALYLKKHAPFDTMGGGIPVIMIGSSHGGYLAHLAAKIAPWLIDGVIDNSSYAKFLWRLVGFGKEIDYTQYSGFGIRLTNNIALLASDKTFWTMNSNSKNFFSVPRRMIRYILEPNHIEIQANYPKPIYTSYHSFYDKKIAPPDEKLELYELLKRRNFDAKLYMIKDIKQIDGKLIKNLKHGMNMSIKALIKKELPAMLEKILKNPKQDSLKSITYPCEDLTYTFKEEQDKIVLEIGKI
ncbi:hypothetical protein C3H96_01925 [Campylobacter jejuni]|uniref:DUF2920 family protein n=1 Tax=Campylobacter jejuni TaxID=197 RepID=UPI000F8098D0|nr:DUF2920 family protein [Campylobacter jejuni]RTI98019.1 hypothetical protein C3H96_01925 [Campylobacter jejuni]